MASSEILPEADAEQIEAYPASPHSLANRAARAVWSIVWLILFRPTPKLMYGWRRFLLRLFGARIDPSAKVFSSVKIWAPWNLEMGYESCLSPHVDCYSVDKVKLGPFAVVSQYSFLCTASHDIRYLHLPLTTAPITIEERAWVAADVFVGPGVTVGQGAVIGARSTVKKDVPPWSVTAGNPAKVARTRTLVSMQADLQRDHQ
jgi:putative colanic acid biosynthesis acetyltransferase WcaF